MSKKKFGISQELAVSMAKTIDMGESKTNYYSTKIAIDRIKIDPENPRKLFLNISDIKKGLNKNDPDFEKKQQEFDEQRILADSIEKEGLIHPVIAYKDGESFNLVAGERRLLATMILGKEFIEARVFNQKPTGYKKKLVQWFENNERKDLTLSERIANIQDLVHAYNQENSDSKLTADSLAKICNLSKPQSYAYLQVINANASIKKAISDGVLNDLDAARKLSSLDEGEARLAINGIQKGELKTSHIKKKKIITPPATRTKPGRARVAVDFGKTKKLEVAKVVLTTLLENPQIKSKLTEHLDIDWTSMSDISDKFSYIINLLERDVSK